MERNCITSQQLYATLSSNPYWDLFRQPGYAMISGVLVVGACIFICWAFFTC